MKWTKQWFIASAMPLLREVICLEEEKVCQLSSVLIRIVVVAMLCILGSAAVHILYNLSLMKKTAGAAIER
jgi:hypothetical protein